MTEFEHRTTSHRSGKVEHTLIARTTDGAGRLRWLHVSDHEAWVLEWVARPQGQGIGTALMDVLTGQTRVEGIDLAPYTWFSAAPGEWAEPFRAWAAKRPGITHKPRPLDPLDLVMDREQRARLKEAFAQEREAE